MLWSEWKKELATKGIMVLDDSEGPYADAAIVSQDQMQTALKLCKVRQVVKPEPVVLRGPSVVAQAPPDDAATWRMQYERFCQEKPSRGRVLSTEDGSKVLISVEENENSEPFLFTRIYVPRVIGQPLGWFAQSERDSSNYGLKLILDRNSRNEVLERFSNNGRITVKKVQVIGESRSGKALIGRVDQW